MKTSFRLYSEDKFNFNSSIFDLIDGDKETKQTKGLAYLFFYNPQIVLELCKQKEIKDYLNKIYGKNNKLENITHIEVIAEKLSASKKRADIVIKIIKNSVPFLVLIIEAKSIKVSVNKESIEKQLLNYLDDEEFPELKNYRKIAIILTKYKYYIGGLISITWDSLIDILSEVSAKEDENSLTVQFINFITGIDKSMKYYEKEVLSIPAGKSLNKVEKYFIYECPDTKAYNFKKPLFITFRNSGGGEMSRLYKIEDIIILNPNERQNLENLENSSLQVEIRERLLSFIEESAFEDDFSYDKKFYILSKSEIIELTQKPKPKRNNVNFTYYKLSDILSKEIVMPESKQ
ncbi:MAG: hypothetical protein ACR2J3_06340 [Aridibacter sp.]